MKLQLQFLFSVFLLPGCITKMITRLPPEKAAEVVRYMDEAENHRNKKWSNFTQASRYGNQADKYLDYAIHAYQKAQKSFNVEDVRIREGSYFEYSHHLKQMLQSYREAIKHGILEIKYRRMEFEKIREVRI